MLRRATDWGSQAAKAKAFLFSTPCQASNASGRLGRATLPNGEARLPRHTTPLGLKCSAGLPIGEARLPRPRHSFFLHPARPQMPPGALGEPRCQMGKQGCQGIPPRGPWGKPGCRLGKPGFQGIPFFYVSETDGKHPATPQILCGAWRLQLFHRLAFADSSANPSATSLQSSLPPHVRELANFLCCMVSLRACYA